MSTLACQKNYSIQITGCDNTTDWVNNPGNCRLRVKNFNPLDWAICGTCAASGLPAWDGTFPSVIIAATTTYNVAAGVSIGGAQNLGPTFSCVEHNPALGWAVILACNGSPPAFMWQSAFFNVASPLMIYPKVGGCTGPANIEVEAYSL